MVMSDHWVARLLSHLYHGYRLLSDPSGGGSSSFTTYGRVMVSTLLCSAKSHAGDGSWPRKNYLPKTSNANIPSDGNTGGSEFEMAMSVAEADAILVKFGTTNAEPAMAIAA